MPYDYDVIIIGAGPAGYTAALRSGQLGMRTALIEKEKLGGMCMNWGCVPAKIFLETAKLLHKIWQASNMGIDGVNPEQIRFNWQNTFLRAQKITNRLKRSIDALLRWNSVEIITGTAHIASETSVTVENRRISAPNIIIATGAYFKNIQLPILSKNIFSISQIWQNPPVEEEIVIMGGNSTAIEIAELFSLIGHKVTMLVSEDRLVTVADPYLSHYMLQQLEKRKINVILNAKVIGGDIHSLTVGKNIISCPIIINSENRIGVIPTSDILLECENHFIKVNNFLQTNVPNIFAIGEVNGKQMLAHVATAQAIQTINYIKGIKEPMNYDSHPINIYSIPEIAQIGLTEPQLKQRKIEYQISEYPLSANAKALAEGDAEGFIRLLSEKKYGEILGVQIAAAHATDMISEAAVLMEMEGTVFDLARVVHAHPTVSEIFLDAGWAAVEKTLLED